MKKLSQPEIIKENTMHCPKCKNKDLTAIKIDKGLSAMGCQQCSGALISLLYYRDWAELSANNQLNDQRVSAEDIDLENVNDTSTALNCPKCARLMRKFRISGCHNNRLDLCNSCDDVWLDDVEWQMLQALQMSNLMPSIFTIPWQTKVRIQAQDEDRKQRYIKILGEDDLNKSEQLRQWLKYHPKRQDIMFYINHQ